MTNLTPDLQYLVSEPVSGVCFVMDYVELHFNGSYLRCLTPPTVARSGTVVTFPKPGSRDALCALITVELRLIEATDGEELRAEFSDGSVLTAPLTTEARACPEALHFHNQATGETQFW